MITNHGKEPKNVPGGWLRVWRVFRIGFRFCPWLFQYCFCLKKKAGRWFWTYRVFYCKYFFIYVHLFVFFNFLKQKHIRGNTGKIPKTNPKNPSGSKPPSRQKNGSYSCCLIIAFLSKTNYSKRPENTGQKHAKKYPNKPFRLETTLPAQIYSFAWAPSKKHFSPE